MANRTILHKHVLQSKIQGRRHVWPRRAAYSPAHLSTDDNCFLASTPRLAGLVYVVKTKSVFRCELVLVDGVLCAIPLVTVMVEVNKKCHEPSSMYVGCLKVDVCVSANLYLANSLSETPSRACSRFLVSANFSPGFTTNLKGTPCVRDTSLEKWKTLMTLSESSASSSSRGISCNMISTCK